MDTAYNNLYVQVEDRYGAVASVYSFFDGNSRIVYHDAGGHKFYEEQFASFPIEVVERYAIDWATGKRDLVTLERGSNHEREADRYINS